MLYTILSTSTSYSLRFITKKNSKSNPKVMKSVGPYRNIQYDSICSYELVITIFPKKLLTVNYHFVQYQDSSACLVYIYFIKICIDGHGRQLKSPKSKKFYPQASTKSFPVVRVTLTNLFYHFEVIANKMKKYSAIRNFVILENEFIQFT